MSRLRGDRTNSDNLARFQVSVLQNAQTIEFFMVRRGQAWSKLAFRAIDFNDNKSGAGDRKALSAMEFHLSFKQGHGKGEFFNLLVYRMQRNFASQG